MDSILFKAFVIATGIGLLSNNLQAQQKIKVVDPLLYRQYENTSDSIKAGIKDCYVILENNNLKDTLMTDSLGIVELDTLKPNVSTNYNPLNPVDTIQVNFEVNANDLSGINKIKLYVDNNLVDSSSNSTLSHSRYLSAGNHNFYAIAIDNSFLRNTKISDTKNFNVISTDTTINLNVNAGWNIISVPLTVKDARKEILFPSSIGFAFKYEDIYKREDTLKNGKGYWLKFNSSQVIPITGKMIIDSLINVNEGWNLISPLSKEVPTKNVKSAPNDIIKSDYFGYEGSYTIKDETSELVEYR